MSDDNRQRFPDFAAFVDELRKFDPECKVRFARNMLTDDSVGRRVTSEHEFIARPGPLWELGQAKEREREWRKARQRRGR